MERLELDEEIVMTKRDEALRALAQLTGPWEPEDDPKREGDVCPGSPLKLHDDVRASDGGTYRVIAPAEGRARFTVYGLGPFGPTYTTLSLFEVVDRAPADPLEPPMPVCTPPEPEPELPSWPPDMAQLRFACFTRVDARSDLMFLAGFDFQGVRLSLSLEAQQRFADMYALRDKRDDLGNFVVPYPLTFSSLDDTATVTITDPAGIEQLYLASAFRKAEIVIGGNQVKDYVREAGRTVQELVNFVDPRPAPEYVPIEPGQEA